MSNLRKIKDLEYIIAEVSSEHKEFLREGIKELSSESVQHRFFLAKKSFTEKELDRLTEYDKKSHYAVGAKTADNPPRGIGIARFNQNSDDLTKAEFAIIVADRFQGNGFGHILLEALIEEAKRRGISELYGQMKSTNTKMISLVKKHGTHKMISEGNGIISLRLLI